MGLVLIYVQLSEEFVMKLIQTIQAIPALTAMTIVAVMGFTSQAQANEDADMFFGTAADALDHGYFQNAKSSLESMTLLRQGYVMFGTLRWLRGYYPENAIEQDTRNVSAIYEDVMAQQATNDPYLRVADLPNPYNSSLMTLPSLQTGRVVGTELVYERLPQRY